MSDLASLHRADLTRAGASEFVAIARTLLEARGRTGMAERIAAERRLTPRVANILKTGVAAGATTPVPGLPRSPPIISFQKALSRSSATLAPSISSAALGKSEDAIAHVMGIHKNVLRAKYIVDIDAGREIARAEAAAAEHDKLSAREQEMENALNAGFDADGNAAGYWKDGKSGGNLLAFTCKTRAEFDAYRAQLATKKTDE